MTKSFRRLALGATLAIAAVAMPTKAFAYGFNPWTGMTGEKTIAINPFLYLPLSPVGFGFDTVAWLGITKNIDVAVNFTTLTVAPSVGWGGFWVMPRVEIFPNGIVGLTVGYNGSALFVKPEFDFVAYPENSIFAFEGNLRVPITFATKTALGIETYLVPAIQIVKGAFAFFVEVNPSLAILPSAAFSMPINPGLWLGLGGGKHQFSLAFTGMAVSGSGFAVSPGLGLSYYTTISL